ncbi:MAG: phage head morphogenesis protein, partial [Oscillospiraceae bacterium]
MNKQQTASYWIELQKEKALRGEKIFTELETELFYLYDEAAQIIINDTAALIQRFGKDNKLSYADSLKLLSSKEYTIWKKSIEKYLSDLSVSGNPQLLIELNTLAMKSRISRNDELLSNVYRNMINIASDSDVKVTDMLKKVVETEFYKTTFGIQKMRGAFNLARIDNGTIRNILSFPWSGKQFSQAIWDNTEALAQLTKRQLSIGFIAGHGVEKMAKSINDIMSKGKYNARRLVRTEGAYFQTQGSLLSYEENG